MAWLVFTAIGAAAFIAAAIAGSFQTAPVMERKTNNAAVMNAAKIIEL